MNDWTPRPRASPGRIVSAWLPVGVWTAVIYSASATPDLQFLPDAWADFVVRKIGHVAVFGILALLLWRALAMTTGLGRPWGWALALTILYAVGDEIHQGFVGGRSAAAVDVAIDAAGAVIAVSLVRLVRSRNQPAPRR